MKRLNHLFVRPLKMSAGGLSGSVEGFEKYSDVEIEKVIQKAKFASLVCFAGGVIVLALYFALNFIMKDAALTTGRSLHLLFVAGILCLTFPLMVRKSVKYFYIPALVAIVMALMVVPFRIYSTGGIYSSLMIYAVIPILVAGLTFEGKGVFFTVSFWVAYLGFLFNQHQQGGMAYGNVDIIKHAALSFAVGVGVVSTIVYVYVGAQLEYKKRIKNIEQKSTIKSFSTALSHEINNPLFIAKMYIGKTDLTSEDYTKINGALNRIEAVILGVQEIEKGTKTFETVDYVGQEQMVDILKD